MPGTEKRGDYFANKAEAIAYYREHEENFKDKPDWLIECVIDFAIQYPNYKEYCEVEAKVKAGKELTAKEKKKYGNLKWEKEMTEYTEGQVLRDHVDIKDAGTYDDIVRDKEAFEKINKYGLTYNDEYQKEGDPNAEIRFRFQNPDGSYVEAVDKDGKLMVDGATPEQEEMVKKLLCAPEEDKSLKKIEE